MLFLTAMGFFMIKTDFVREPAVTGEIVKVTGMSHLESFLSSAGMSLTGAHALSDLFLTEEGADEWREEVDKWFSESFLGYFDPDEWIDEICQTFFDKEPADWIFVDTVLEERPYLLAHVEAERAEITQPDESTAEMQTFYIYKISYLVNTEYEDVEFNIELKGDRDIELYTDDVKVEKGDEKIVFGESMIVQNSSYYYDEICIEFDKEYKLSGGEYKSGICNDISESDTTPTAYDPENPDEYGEDNPDEPEINQI